MNKETYKYHLELVTKYCMRCKNEGTGKDGPCPKCVYKSRFNKPLPPISFEEKLMEKIIDLNPFFKPTFLKDMKTGYTLHLSQRFENTSEYEVSELCRFLPGKDRILTRSEMLEHFSEIIVYLLDKGFTIQFKDGWKELGDYLEIIVVDGNRKQNYILRDEPSMFSENPITPETAFRNFYVDIILLSLKITANYHRVLFEILERVYNPQN